MTLVLGHTMAVLDISLPAVEVSHNDDESGKPKHVFDEPRSGCEHRKCGAIRTSQPSSNLHQRGGWYKYCGQGRISIISKES